ncbi:carboxylesterase [Coprinellus micaceus]|uniref:Carboxylesterase n=1 Tax=Coprinellus micaceus TaxID=71717 RepID=A0A4Y7TVD8_COPMI|nr:carboxylesterase [Coprinellus micaceus]
MSCKGLLLPFLFLGLLLGLSTAAGLPGTPLLPNVLNLKRRTTSGVVEGFLDFETTPDTPLLKWLGVRFAQDTSGTNRWLPPQPVVPELGAVFNASEYGPACLQGRADGGNGTAIQSEDCLRINVIAPAGARNLPVYIYAHGGGFDSGASSDPKIDGTYLAARGIVFASFNYRLSLWGFPHSSELSKAGETQNLGLLDTRAAVEWLYANVKQFGGDPRKITLGGESVGAGMTNFYMSAYHRDPLIRAAIMQSGDVAQPMWPIDSQLTLLSSKLGCPTSQLDCLRKQDGQELRKVLLETGAQFQPVTDNITIWKDYVQQTKAGRTAQIPLLIGTNKDEGTLIVEGEPTAYRPTISAYITSNHLNFPLSSLSSLASLYPVPSVTYPTAYNASAAIWRDAHMLCHASNLATLRSSGSQSSKNVTGATPVWRYRWDHVAPNLNSRGERIGAFHGSDIRFVMGQWRTIVLSPPFIGATPEQTQISDLMVTAWTNFVKDPRRGPRIPGWEKYDSSKPSTLAILGTSTTRALPGNHTEVDAVCEYWNTLLSTFPAVFPACGNWTC